MRQLGAPVKHETSHPSALLGTPSWTCRCLSGAATTVMAKARGPGPAASSRTGTAGSRVGARCCARSLGRRPPVAVPRVGAPSPPCPAPARPRRRQLMGPQSPDHRWTAKGMDGGRKSPSGRASCPRYAARAARGAVRIVALRVAREGRRPSKTAGCRPLQTLCSRKKAVMTCGNNRSFFPSAAFLNYQT